MFKTAYLLLLLNCILFSCTPAIDQAKLEQEIEKYIQIPSPKWEDQVIYFIVTDRFMDGDTSNNDQGMGEYKKGDERFWNGGDLKGITQKIDYIKQLGASAIWITPPVANQWRNPQKTGTGNHGYWANNFVEVDRHYGSLKDYQQLSANLHKNEMYLIQDVVVNHLGDFYTYTGEYDPNDVTKNFKLHEITQPTQFPFYHNNATKDEDREMAIYHFAPNFHDHSDTLKKRAYQFADLDDLNTANPLVRTVLRKSYNFWLDEVGVDGFRFDTPHMVEHEFWNDFLHSNEPEAMGIINFAKKLGKDHFLNFGETAVLTQAYEDQGSKEASSYLGSKEKPEMNSVLNFPLYNAIQDVFKGLKSTDQLSYRLEANKQYFEHPEYLCNFIDNHDGARFLSQSDQASFRQALLFVLSIPGIPVIYYGTEQELLGMRQTMFKGGVGSVDKDHFDTKSDAFQFVQNLIQLRKDNPAFRRGDLKILRDISDGPGTFAYQMAYQDENIIILFNTSESKQLADNLPTGFDPGTLLETVFSLSNSKEEFTVNEKGNLSVILPPKAGIVLRPTDRKTRKIATTENIQIEPLATKVFDGDYLNISGSSTIDKELFICVDGDLELAQKVTFTTSKQWSAQLPLYNLQNGKHRITLFHWPADDGDLIQSSAVEFELNNKAILLAEYYDEHGDDRGLNNNLQYATHESFTHQGDIESVKIYKVGTNLKVDLTMKELSQMWLPPNGFDHILLNIYIDMPNKIGIQDLPQQNYKMPNKGHWDYLISTAGFANAMYSSKGASSTNVGELVGPTPVVKGNLQERTISFSIASKALGSPQNLRGTKLYLNTWDGGPGNLKGMNPIPSLWSPGGGDQSDPIFFDDTELIILN